MKIEDFTDEYKVLANNKLLDLYHDMANDRSNDNVERHYRLAAIVALCRERNLDVTKHVPSSF